MIVVHNGRLARVVGHLGSHVSIEYLDGERRYCVPTDCVYRHRVDVRDPLVLQPGHPTAPTFMGLFDDLIIVEIDGVLMGFDLNGASRGTHLVLSN